MRIGHLTFAFSGAHKWAELLRNPCILGGPQKGDEIRIASLTVAFSGAHRWADLLCNPCILGRQRLADLLRNPCILGRRQQGQQNENWLRHLCILGGLEVGGKAM